MTLLIDLFVRNLTEFNLIVSPSLIQHSSRSISKFHQTSSVLDKPRSGPPRASDEIRIRVIEKVENSPKKSLKRSSIELGVP